jgi:Ca2+-binding RTX toxin-like protein
VNRPALLAALVAAFAATAAPAHAAVSSASIGASLFNGEPTATLNLDGAGDDLTVSVSGGLLVHDQTGGGLNSEFDWESAKDGDQTLAADGTVTVIVNGGDGDDTLTVLAKSTEIAGASLNGEGGDDTLTGADASDILDGGDGADRLVGGKGIDLIDAGPGNDTAVWNDGDGSDRINGEAGDDRMEVNGSPKAGDTFTLDPVNGGVRLLRTNLEPSKLDIATERLDVNGLGGNDSVSASAGVGAQTLLSVDGGAGADTISGSEGPDLITGGDGNDVLHGGGGDDTISPGAGVDVVSADDGDDRVDLRDNTSDSADGGAGNDSVVADRAALDVVAGFETVDRTPEVTAPPVITPPPVDTSTRPLTIGGATVRVDKLTASIRVRCPALSPGDCTGSLRLRTAKAVRIGRHEVMLQLGRAQYDLAPGSSSTLRVKLAARTERLVNRKGRLRVLALASTGPAGKIARSSRHLTLALRASINGR